MIEVVFCESTAARPELARVDDAEKAADRVKAVTKAPRIRQPLPPRRSPGGREPLAYRVSRARRGPSAADGPARRLRRYASARGDL